MYFFLHPNLTFWTSEKKKKKKKMEKFLCWKYFEIKYINNINVECCFGCWRKRWETTRKFSHFLYVCFTSTFYECWMNRLLVDLIFSIIYECYDNVQFSQHDLKAISGWKLREILFQTYVDILYNINNIVGGFWFIYKWILFSLSTSPSIHNIFLRCLSVHLNL
jgi:hypothetical protein